jgi:Family of unknown function (DUF6481)
LLKPTDDLRSNPSRQARELFKFGLVHTLEYGAVTADLKPSTVRAKAAAPWAHTIEMDRSKNTGFADRMSTAAEAKKAQLERAAQARSTAESPAAAEQRAEREALRAARDARIAERKAAKLAAEARQAAALAAAQVAEAAAREAALKAEQEPAMWSSLSKPLVKPPWRPSGKPLATPAMPLARHGSEKANRITSR